MLDEEVIQTRLDHLKRAGIIAIVRGNDPERMYERGHDLVELGCRALEVTLDSPRALDVLYSWSQDFDDEVILGVGTLLDPNEAEECVNAGAKFALSPVNPAGFVNMCSMHGVLGIPGVATLDELFKAQQGGARIAKLFPATSWNVEALQYAPPTIKSLPWIPVGGVDRKSCWKWMEAGAWAVGMGTHLCGSDLAIDPINDPRGSELGLRDWRQREGPRARGIFMELERRREIK